MNIISTDKAFLEGLVILIKELVIENLNEIKGEYEYLKGIINNNWVEMKTEFISLLSNTFNKQIEVVYLLDNKAESMIYDKVKSKFNQENTKIRLLYYHNIKGLKSHTITLLIDNEEIHHFLESRNSFIRKYLSCCTCIRARKIKRLRIILRSPGYRE